MLARQGQYEEAERWGHFANQALSKYQSKQLEAKVKFVFYAVVQMSQTTFRDSLKPIWESHRLGMRTGDLEVSWTFAVCRVVSCRLENIATKLTPHSRNRLG